MEDGGGLFRRKPDMPVRKGGQRGGPENSSRTLPRTRRLSDRTPLSGFPTHQGRPCPRCASLDWVQRDKEADESWETGPAVS